MPSTRRFSGFLFRRAIEIVAIALLFTSIPVLLVETASAQELIRRQTFFERLFSRPSRRQSPVVEPQQRRVAPSQRRQRQNARPQQRRSAPAARAAAPAKPKIEKDEDAKVVLIVGDFLAGGAASGLNVAYEEIPSVRFDDRSRGASGFVRDDYFDWNGAITPLIEQVNPSAVVVMIGSNDRQNLMVNGQSQRPQSEEWLKEYTARVSAFAEKLKASNIPFIWVGLLPFKSPSMSSDMVVFSDIQETAAEAAGGAFVEVWEGFVDDNGAFTTTGPDINGQSVQLRTSDGINLTQDARRKLAFYIEKPLNQILGTAVSPSNANSMALDTALETAPVNIKDLTRVGPVSLSDPSAIANGGLLAGKDWTAPEQSLMLSEPQPGRADFMMQAPATAADSN